MRALAQVDNGRTLTELEAKNPDVSRRVVKSFVDGIHLMRTNPEVAKKAINRYMRLNDERELEEKLIHC